MRRIIEGKLFIDGFGRLYFDKCETNGQHMLTPGDTPDEDGHLRRTCRVYVEDIFRDFVGKRGLFGVEISEIGTEGRIEVALPVSEEELLAELNYTSFFLGKRQAEKEDLFEREKMNTAQVIALGALFFKHLQEMPGHNKNLYLAIVQQVGETLKEA